MLVYLLLAVALTWPLASRFRTALPAGTERVATVPLFNAWTVWWNAESAMGGFVNYWDAPIFSPLPDVFTFSEAQPTTLIVAPILFLDGPASAYNIYLISLLTLNGWLASRLLRRVGIALAPALVGGCILEALPIVHWQLGVLQLAAICGPLWVFERLVALRQRVTWIRAGSLGVAAALCYAACNYWGLFLSVLLPLACWPLLWGRLKSVRLYAALVAAVVLAAMLASPILLAQWDAKKRYDWNRDLSLLKQLSAQPQDYLNPPWNRLPVDRVYQDGDRSGWYLGTGPILLASAACGLVYGLFARGLRLWTLFFVLLGGLAFGLSLGPDVTVPLWSPWWGYWDWSPYRSVMAVHPGLEIARSPFRFAFFVQIVLGLLAANSLDGGWRGVNWVLNQWWHRGGQGTGGTPVAPVVARLVGTLLVVAVGGLAVAESWPEEQPLVEVPSLEADWIGWLGANGDRSRPVVCLPFVDGRRVEHYERTARSMYQQIRHGRPLVGGYTGFFPAEHLRLRDEMESFPDPEVLEELRLRDVEFVVATDLESIERAEESGALRLAFRDESARVNIYRWARR